MRNPIVALWKANPTRFLSLETVKKKMKVRGDVKYV